ncbi:tetratricopeptide repeat-containing sensor histidine kinase [Salinimicrobium flavum]|uniref:histidine kinase n=1 Tax=Salinimicrobium flavum TaxID=1737065 RepID=A0ABW5IXF0_9FLAO
MKIGFCVFLGAIFLFTSCKQEELSEIPPPPVEPGSPAFYYEQGLETSDLDEKLRLYETGLGEVKSRRDSNLVALLEGKVYVLMRRGEYDLAEKWTDSLIKAAHLQQDTFFLAKAYYRKSILRKFGNDPIGNFRNAFISRQLHLQAGDSSFAARRTMEMAEAQLDMADYAGSQESATEAIKYLDNERDSIFISSAYNLIGLAYLYQDFHEDAIKEYQNALRYSARPQDSLTFLHNIAIAYKNNGNYDAALPILEKIAVSDVPSPGAKSRYLDNLAFTRWLKDPSARVDSLFFEALETKKELNDMEGLYNSYHHLASYYEDKDKQKAIQFAKQSLEAARKNSSPSGEVSVLKKLIDLIEGPGEKEYVDRYIFLHDSLDEANLKAKYHFAKIRFDEQRKQQEINSLEKENFLQTLKTERLQTRNLVISLLGLLILFVAGALLYYFRQRSRKEKIREIYLTESRISKRIHDELANDVYNLMSRLESGVSEGTVDELEHIYHRTRDISRENSEIETGKDFIQGLVSNLKLNTGGAKLILRGETIVAWDKIPEEKKIVIYRVLQELMINMKKHSKAKLVAIVFSRTGQGLEITFTDNGEGSDPEAMFNGNGLKNVKNRVASVNGKIELESAKGKGFKAKIRIPV